MSKQPKGATVWWIGEDFRVRHTHISAARRDEERAKLRAQAEEAFRRGLLASSAVARA